MWYENIEICMLMKFIFLINILFNVINDYMLGEIMYIWF